MKYKMYLFALCISACFSKATTDAETVWLTEVTAGLQTDKRRVTSPDFPDQLSFHLKGKTHELVLNLERNYLIDTNVDTYTVQRTIDGQPLLKKMENLEKADVAYYQDMEHGAFMTARCVKRSSGQCDIFINGNIRLGDRSYNMQPSEADVIPIDFLEITDLRGKRYVLQDQAHVQSGLSGENNGETNGMDKNVQEKHTDLPRRIPYGEDKQNLFIKPHGMFPAGNVERFQNIFPTGAINDGRKNTKNDKARNRLNYHVDVVVLADSGLWEFFLALANSMDPDNRDARAHTEIREYLLHIINGVDQLYKGIEDRSISISVGIVAFVIYQTVELFPHVHSKVKIQVGKSMINGDKYLQDLQEWDIRIGSINLPAYDQAIMFTRHSMKSGVSSRVDRDGRSITGSVCDIGRRVSIVRVKDFYKTTRTAAHGLGHALGALHDGEYTFTTCRPEEKFIMSPLPPFFKPGFKYGLNPWKFSVCAVDSFKTTLVSKTCVKTKTVLDQDIRDEFERVLRTPLGEKYTTNQQCAFSNGHGSVYTGTKLDIICSTMRCTDPTTNQWNKKFITAATGTICGDNKSCQRGMCLPKP